MTATNPIELKPVDTERKLDVNKTFNLRPMSTGKLFLKILKIHYRGVFKQACLHEYFLVTGSVICLALLQFSFLDDYKMKIITSGLWQIWSAKMALISFLSPPFSHVIWK